MLSKLRHPVRAIREPFGTAGLIIACVALIAALAGGAYAASGGLTAKQKKEVKKIAKAFAGQPGAQGPKGDTGPKGDQGPKGNTGAEGPEGSPWTVGGVLPSEQTEVGHWGYGIETDKGQLGIAPLSFNIPLEAPPTLHFIDSEGKEVVGGNQVTSTECLGSVSEPTAEPGALCVYVGFKVNAPAEPFLPDVDVAGATLKFAVEAPSNPQINRSYMSGTWAVTAE